VTTPHRDPQEIVAAVSSDLERAEVSDDATRLMTLEDLYGDLERELEGDPDQAGTARR